MTQWSGDPGTGTKLAEWTYDAPLKGHPSSATRYSGGQAYTETYTAYDSSYRVTGSRISIPAAEGDLAGNYDFTLAYDAAGNLIEQGMPGKGDLPAEKLTLGYTDLGLAKSLTSDYGGGTTYVKETKYSNVGRIIERQYGAAAQIKRTFGWDDGTGWLNRLTTTTKADTSTPQTAQDDQLTYDTDGQLKRILDTPTGQSECFAYDELSRLTAAYTTTGASCAAQPDGQGADPYNQSFTYDNAGNIKTLADGGVTATYAYPTTATRPNAVTSIAWPGRTDTYSYDNGGQLAGRTVDGKQATFTWNPLGQLDKVVTEGQETSMVYDADGERLIRRDPDGGRTLYLGAMEVKASAGQVKATRYYSTPDGAVVAMRNGGGLIWLASGLHGSTQVAIDQTTGNIMRERYLPYGQRRGQDDLPFTDRGFLGHTEDAATGLDYLSARYYDPAIGRFISPDPLLNEDTPQWLNPYAYSGDDPIGSSDPTGLRPDPGRPESSVCANPHTVECKRYRKQQADAERAAAQSEVDRQLKALLNALMELGKIVADELGITDGINCLFKGDLAACGATALNILGSLAGGLASKLAAKYALPWKWKKAIELGKRIWKHAGDAIERFKAWLKGKDWLKRAGDAVGRASGELAACLNSFVPGTLVVMADGSRKPIEEVDVGDEVLATDPTTGDTTAKPVTALITGDGTKHLVSIELKGQRAPIVATDHHPFWVAGIEAWVYATDLLPGLWLRTSSGTYVQISAVTRWTATGQRVHNLTVDGYHAYHVALGSTDVLVHNTGCGPVLLGKKKDIEDYGKLIGDFSADFLNIKGTMAGGKKGAGGWNWTRNKKFILEALQNREIRLVTDPTKPLYQLGNTYQRELKMLKKLGFGWRYVPDAFGGYWRVIRVRPY